MNNLPIQITIAQINLLVGDIEGNTEKIITCIQQAEKDLKTDVIIFPELTLTGYPPEDLLLRPKLYKRIALALEKIKVLNSQIDIILGYPEKIEAHCYNTAAHIQKGKIIATYHKQCLANYSVFDELRYFTKGKHTCITQINDIPVALLICEDIWHEQPILDAQAAGAKLIISINASPFAYDKFNQRIDLLKAHTKKAKLPIVYANLVGAQDELVFDGGSLVINEKGELIQQANLFQPDVLNINLSKTITIPYPTFEPEQLIYEALVLGVTDYIEKNHFPSAVIGLSGGIDSALTLAVATDAVGKERVQAVMMPSRYTSNVSIDCAKQQITSLGVKYTEIPIEPIFTNFLNTLEENAQLDLEKGVARENLQARIRGNLLMAISNQKGSIVLSTGNKTEMAVGYATLYGDMVGGFAVLKDIPKRWVYKLANYRNQLSQVIPREVIDRIPSAELAYDQTDQDSLPPYDILDNILERYIEKEQSCSQIMKAGFDEEIVKKTIRLINKSEYKRHQAPVGVKITQKAFGRDRRYPITSGYSRYLG